LVLVALEEALVRAGQQLPVVVGVEVLEQTVVLVETAD
jgi:hypothetical protein